MADNRITDRSKDRNYFIIVPQIVQGLCADPYELSLWVAIKTVAGEEGECYLSTEDLAELAMMSVGKASQCRKHLLAAGLLEGEIRRDAGYPQAVWHLSIPDLWARNVEWRQAHPSLKERIALKERQAGERWKKGEETREGERERKKSLHTVKPSHSERKPSHSEAKKNQQEKPTESVGVVFSLAQQEALDALLEIGTTPGPARDLASRCGSDQVVGWCEYAKADSSLENPPGLVVAMLRAAAPAPPRLEAARSGPESGLESGEGEWAAAEVDLEGKSDIEPVDLTIPGIARDAGQVWQALLEEIRMCMTRATYDRWLRDSVVIAVSARGLIVQVRDGYAVDWLQARWQGPIKRVLTGILGGSDLGIEYVARNAMA